MKELKIFMLSAAIGLTLAVGISAATYAYAKDAQKDIAKNVIRFHVLANSDSEEDQALKLLVRDRVLEKFRSGLEPSLSLAETKKYLTENLTEVKACAEGVIKEQGCDYPVTVEIGRAFFPTKAYGDVTFPPGEYEALRILIGEAEGRNWWCVMFPPLCYVDLTRPIPEPEKQQLSEAVSEEGYKLLTYQEQDGNAMQVKFKIVELWQNITASGEEDAEAVIAANE